MFQSMISQWFGRAESDYNDFIKALLYHGFVLGLMVDLAETAQKALDQIERMKYESMLEEGGIPKERIRKYGFAFEGKKVLIK